MIQTTKVINILRKTRFNTIPSASLSEINTTFKVLISCILSLRTKDSTTIAASRRLFQKASNPYKMSKLNARTISKLIYPVGFYRTKANNIKDICDVIITDYKGNVPDSINKLMKLKGVGRKTACITMMYGFKKIECIPVDTHVHRISNRLGWVKTKKPEETELALMKLLTNDYWFDLNRLFVSFGQNICVPISPFCSVCPVNMYCKKVNVVH